MSNDENAHKNKKNIYIYTSEKNQCMKKYKSLIQPRFEFRREATIDKRNGIKGKKKKTQRWVTENKQTDQKSLLHEKFE